MVLVVVVETVSGGGGFEWLCGLVNCDVEW